MPKSKALRTFEREFYQLRKRFMAALHAAGTDREKEIALEEHNQAREDLLERLGPTLTDSELEAWRDDLGKQLISAEAALHTLKRLAGVPDPGNDPDKPN